MVLSARSRLSDDSGFTIIEVMVAALVLLVGLLATLTLVDTANSTTATTKAREQETRGPSPFLGWLGDSWRAGGVSPLILPEAPARKASK